MAPTGKLPARAQQLISGTEAVRAASRRTRSPKSDPFQAPASHAATAAAPASDSTPKDKSASTAAPASGAQGATTAPSSPAVSTPPPATPVTPSQPGGDDGSAPAPASGARGVDVRFGERIPARLQRRIPRLQTFAAHGAILAIFVKYSPTRDKAVFAIAPSTRVEGQIECRRKAGLCRYIDIPAGKGVRLTTRGSDGAPVTRRLDVARIVRPSQTDVTATASSAPADGSCLLGKLLALRAVDLRLAGDACSS
jgi:hypothetical protein